MKAKSDLRDADVAREFYDKRYSTDYMYGWEVRKKRWTLEILRSLDLPKVGKALDFGCGNGIFAELLTRALPGWAIFGTDISPVAIEKAQKRVKNCCFLSLSGLEDETAALKTD